MTQVFPWLGFTLEPSGFLCNHFQLACGGLPAARSNNSLSRLSRLMHN